MTLLARDVSKRIEEEMDYPGQIKVNIIRETRVVDYAKQCVKYNKKSRLLKFTLFLLIDKKKIII